MLLIDLHVLHTLISPSVFPEELLCLRTTKILLYQIVYKIRSSDTTGTLQPRNLKKAGVFQKTLAMVTVILKQINTSKISTAKIIQIVNTEWSFHQFSSHVQSGKSLHLLEPQLPCHYEPGMKFKLLVLLCLLSPMILTTPTFSPFCRWVRLV